jgi:hypothetical protein
VNRVLRKIFGRKSYKVREYLGKHHNEDLPNLYSSPSYEYNLEDRVKEDNMGRACSTIEEDRNAYRVFAIRDHYEYQYVYRWIILELTLRRQDRVVPTSSIWLTM